MTHNEITFTSRSFVDSYCSRKQTNNQTLKRTLALARSLFSRLLRSCASGLYKHKLFRQEHVDNLRVRGAQSLQYVQRKLRTSARQHTCTHILANSVTQSLTHPLINFLSQSLYHDSSTPVVASLRTWNAGGYVTSSDSRKHATYFESCTT